MFLIPFCYITGYKNRQMKFIDFCVNKTQFSFQARHHLFLSLRRSGVRHFSLRMNGFDYDLIAIGGGSGGLACAKEAADLGRKVALLDFVDPSPHGSTWGIGGTCVNVGCIPKKLMHNAAIVGQVLKDAKSFGWKIDNGSPPSHDWSTLVTNVQNYIRSVNWIYKVQLREKNVDYINGKASFVDKNTILVRQKNGKERTISAEHILIATGGRPRYPEIPGSEFGISSDDVFSLKSPPGKTLVVGASYVALECAGFLAALNYPVTLMIRSIPLRGFDQQMAALVVESLAQHGVNVLNKTVPTRVEKLAEQSPKYKVYFKDNNNQEISDVYDTVLWAIGRYAPFENMNLKNAGVQIGKSGKLIVDKADRTNVVNIHAIGDVQEGRPELTPVAILAGKLLSKRLFGGSKELMEYDKIPTTVFTPTEYGMVGLSEELAFQKFGEDNLEVYHTFFTPLEYALPLKEEFTTRGEEKFYLKIICLRNKPRIIVGLHFFGPNAGEVVQGYASAIR
uniref:thioredoxin-disulfide reductase (NADPH) n=1 Tax=Romanomermis culicivorax TaxID=13658 RepID=A0A915JIK2_ROMCU